MYKDIVNRKDNKFYPVTEVDIQKAQESMGVVIPNNLKEFYKEVGYGFLNSTLSYFNRLMDPNSVCEFRLRDGQFANNPELEIYTEDEHDKLIFFEVCEGYFLSIGFTKNNEGKIFNGQEEIASNLEEFLAKYQEDENYF